jgi:hypothetical protein
VNSTLFSEWTLKSLRGLAAFDSTIRRFESSRQLPLTTREKPANGGLLRFIGQSPDSKFRALWAQIAESLRTNIQIFPFLGDRYRRPGSISTPWPTRQCKWWYIEIMADGQVVLVTTEPLGGGSPVRSVYFVAEHDPEKAKAIIGAMMAPNEKVEAWGRLPEAAVKALGLKPGDFKHG